MGIWKPPSNAGVALIPVESRGWNAEEMGPASEAAEQRWPASLGDVLDRCTILTIKAQRIRGFQKLDRIQRQLAQLKQSWQHAGFGPLESYTQWDNLVQINSGLWEAQDMLRELERDGDFGELFVRLSRSVYKLNDQRSQVKQSLNEQLDSPFVEEKSYDQDEAGPRVVGGGFEERDLPGATAEPLTGTNLVDQALEALEVVGACVLRAADILSPSLVTAVLNDCQDLPTELDDGLEPGVIRCGPYHLSKNVRSVVTCDFALELSARFLPVGPRLDTVMFRHPLRGFGQQRLHRDPPFPALTFLLNLSPVTRDNGATRVQLGTHRIPEEVDLATFDDQDLVWVESPEPTVCVIDNRLFHGGSRNIQGLPRPLLYWIYRDMDAESGGCVQDQAGDSDVDRYSVYQRQVLTGMTKQSVFQTLGEAGK